MKTFLIVFFTGIVGVSFTQNYLRCADYIPLDDTVISVGNIYFVSPLGDNSNPGTEAEPWLTIQQAAWTMNAGDITYVKGGTYNETNISFSNAGTAQDPIVLSAYSQNGVYDSVFIDGSNDSGWSAGFLINNSGLYLKGLVVQNMNNHGVKVNESAMQYDHLYFKDLTIRNNGDGLAQGVPGHGLLLNNVNDFKIENVESYNNHGNGIGIMGHDTTSYSENGWIVNSSTHDNNDDEVPFASNAHGIAIDQGQNIAVCGCMSYNNTDHGYDVSDWPKGGLLSRYITLENNTSLNNQSAAGIAINSDSHHILFNRNLIARNYVGIYGYSGVGRLEFYNNVSMYNRNQGLLITDEHAVFVDPGDSTIVVHNNILYKNDSIGYDYFELQIDTSNLDYAFDVQHNVFYTNDGSVNVAVIGDQVIDTSGMDYMGSNNLFRSPHFVDTISHLPDVHCDSMSIVLNSGIPVFINGMEESYIGSAPEIGIYEMEDPVMEEPDSSDASVMNLDIGEIIVYPNPASDFVYCKIPSGQKFFTFEITDQFGRLIEVEQIEFNEKVLFNISGLNSGVYYMIYTNKSNDRIIPLFVN